MVGQDFKYLCHLLCQFSNSVEIVVFPPYYPTLEEKKNPCLFSENVRKLMVYGTNLKSTSKIKFSKEKFIRNLKVEEKK
jgi:hypothetical protein